MKSYSVFTKFIGIAVLLAANIAMAQTVVVTPGNLDGWFGKAGSTGTFGLGIADQQGGTSSLLMSTDGTAGQIINLARVPIPLLRVSDLTSVSWDVYSDNTTWYPEAQIEYWSPTNFGTLVYDASNLVLTANTWTTVTIDFNNDVFWSTAHGQGDLRTLAAWQAEPTVGPVLINFFRIGYGSTGATTFPATTAYTDFVELNGTTWDFQDVAVLPPQPPLPNGIPIPTLTQWAIILLVMGLGLVAFRSMRRKTQ